MRRDVRRRGTVLLSTLLVSLAILAAGFSLVPTIWADNRLQETVPDEAPPAQVPPEDPAPATPPATGSGDDGAEPEPMLVNKAHALPDGYEPPDLRRVEIPFSFTEDAPRRMMRDEAAAALERLFAQAEADGIELAGVSGYRSYATQAEIFASASQRYGSEEAANRVSARPGQSEHQTGLAMDVSSRSVGYQLTEAFGATVEGQWLARTAPRFGFIVRYPEGEEPVTGYQYEPWHVRYVGEQHAARIVEKGTTLEEYLEA